MAASCISFESRMYIRLNRSFSKHEPPNPIEHYRNDPPILLSELIMDLTSLIDAPYFSQRAVIELIELILWASIALLINFPSSLLAYLQ